MATRGRPIGTRKRQHAEAAALDMRDGKFADLHEAALVHFAKHRGTNAPLVKEGEQEYWAFRDFRRYVEEAYDELSINEPRGLRRRFLPLAKRAARRRMQPNSPTNPIAELKRAWRQRPLHQLRVALGLEPDDPI